MLTNYMLILTYRQTQTFVVVSTQCIKFWKKTENSKYWISFWIENVDFYKWTDQYLKICMTWIVTAQKEFEVGL